MAASKYIIVGGIARPHGIRGELIVDSHADSPTYFARGSTLRLSPPSDPGRGRDYLVRASRLHQDRFLVTLDGINDRNAAETLRGLAVCVPVEQLVPPAPDEVFLQDLFGLRVRLAAAAPTDPDLGRIEDIRDLGGPEIWVIRDPKGREILFPATDEFVRDIDLDAGLVVIDPPPGLLDLYLVDE
ncbi:ribosome maturation factor RimM [Solidesulfovibrio sp.]